MPLISKTKLYECITFILTNTTFNFNDSLYQQMFGTTMGARFSVKFANVYMHVFLTKFFHEYPGEVPPLLARLVDDLFLLWNTNIETINTFITALNSYHPSIKFTANISNKEIQFLDTIVYKKDNQLYTKLYVKPSDNQQYLHYNRSHPVHIKHAIPFSQAIRYRRIITEEEELNASLTCLKQKFVDRAYPEDVVNKQIDRIRHIKRQDTLTYKTRQERLSKNKSFIDKETLLPLIITYHPNYLTHKTQSIHKLIHTRWYEFLQDTLNKYLKIQQLEPSSKEDKH